MGIFQTADEELIKAGECSDICLKRCCDMLIADNLNPRVTVEVAASVLPHEWGVFCGLADALKLLEGVDIDVYAMPEGSMFYSGEPVMRITGNYQDFARFETALCGFLSQASGVATAAAFIRLCADKVPVYSLCAGLVHPAISAAVERSAWIGGIDGVNGALAPAGIPHIDVMPHNFVMCHSNSNDAWNAFERLMPAEISRVMVCGTRGDIRSDAIAAAKAGAAAVRIDVSDSIGSIRRLIEELRWELDTNGFTEVGIFVAGNLSPEDVSSLNDCADAFGIGGAIANAPSIDFSFDIVEADGVPVSRRGNKSGAKEVYEYEDGSHILLPLTSQPPEEVRCMTRIFIKNGQILNVPDMQKSRARVLSTLAKFS